MQISHSEQINATFEILWILLLDKVQHPDNTIKEITHVEVLQKYDDGNLLTRGQTIENVPLDKTTPLILKAGQMSLHHPTLVHGSGLNKSNDRRIGFVIQSYIGTNVDQVIGKVYVQQARGTDIFKYHEHTKRPVELMSKKDVALRVKANEELSKIFYSEAREKGKY